MITIPQLISVAIAIALGVVLMGKSRTVIARAVSVSVFANMATLAVLIFGLEKTTLYGTTPSLADAVLYTAIATLIEAVSLLVISRLFTNGVLVSPASPFRVRSIWPVVGGAVLGFLAGLFFFVPMWFGSTFGKIPADHFMFLLTEGGGESTRSQDLEVLNLMVVPPIASAVAGGCLGMIRSRIAQRRKARSPRAISMAVLSVMVVCSVVYAFATVPLEGILRQKFTSSDFIENNYVVATSENVKLPAKKRNLVHIYMESVENSFYSRDMGGYLDVNLMPELAQLSNTGVSFSNTDTFGGPQQLYATGHSIAAMVNMWAGTPMLASGAGNGKQMSYPDFPTIGDVLHDNGYNTEFMLGASARWGGLGDYYRRHGDFHVFDYRYAQDQGIIPKDYHEWWGFEDDKLYDFAKDELTRLSSDNKPFYFVLENADTHFPNGYVSKNMKSRPFEKQYANVIHYSQAETVKMIKWIQSQPWGADTTIVVTGDHRSMDKNFFQGWDSSYNRTVINFILNPVQGTKLADSVTKNRTYAPFDFFPTILSSIGATIKDDRLGLGTDLFTGKPTLTEQYSVDKLNSEFEKNSPFYDAHRETEAATPDISQDRKF